MPVCATCGHEAPEAFKFCPECGAPAAAAPASREQRKTVTVLFCDVTGSTALGESIDPEALRALLAHYFERMQGIVDAHGGTVEKFIGDAVMAVFGVPRVHEDDALRACRAAVEMRDALPELGVQARIGVNTGEVVTGTQERLATGDAVNVAARLEQAAAAGEILIGEATLQLVREAVEAEPVEPLDLKGKAEPVPAHRLIAVTGNHARRHEAPMVGRETELRRLQDAYEQTVRNRSCQLFTVLGSAGVGKSRLAYEFLRRTDARIVRGRCLSYGEGITYWPVLEVLKELGTLPDDLAGATSLRSLLRETDAPTSADEIAWAFRKLLERVAQDEPLACVFDDIHWAEETFLDLIEHVADLSREAPIMLLCLARPELLDKRPSWGGGKLNATTVLLEPLSADETGRLLAELGGVEEDLLERIVDAAEGNPLFVEEMLALVRESGAGEVQVPGTIQALLAARLDQLDPADRVVLDRGSVEGRVFHRAAVEALAPDEPQVPRRLVSLVRKELVRPDKPLLRGDDAFRFRHLLIRDAAYEALPKGARAELHERFAAWLEGRAPELAELDEIVGHHLQEAARYRVELGRADQALADRAAARLAAAGRRALWRGDRTAAARLIERALELTRPARLDVDLEMDLSECYFWSDARRAAEICDAAASRAGSAGDARGETVARTRAALCRLVYEHNLDEVETLAREALTVLDDDDHAGHVPVWVALGWVANFRGQADDWATAGEQALRHSRAAGERYTTTFGLGAALLHGPRPADDALAKLDELMPDSPHPTSALIRVEMLAMLGRLAEAREVATREIARLEEMGGEGGGPIAAETLAVIEEYEGNIEAAVRAQARCVEEVERRGQAAFLSTQLGRLGRLLCDAGRFGEAEVSADRARETGDEDDITTAVLWRDVQALVRSDRGDHGEAERLVREAVAVAERSDHLNLQALAYADLGRVLAAAGRPDEAAAAMQEALARYERKRNVVMAGRTRERLDSLFELQQ